MDRRTENMFSASAIIQARGGAEKVCRNLFGTVDHEAIKRDFEANLGDMLEEAKHKWNFDFVSETPLEGDYLWERVEDPNQEITAEDSDTDSILVSVQELESGGSNSCKRKQTLITDYYQVKRHCSPLPSPSECRP